SHHSSPRYPPSFPTRRSSDLDAAVVLELSRLGVAGLRVSRALVSQRDEQALVQEGQLAKPLRQRVEVVLGNGEDFFIGQELNFRSEETRLNSSHVAISYAVFC